MASEEGFGANREWLAKEKNVVVSVDGLISAKYTYSFLLKDSAQELVVIEVPRDNFETDISHVWGRVYCDGKEITAATKKGSLVFSESCLQQPFEYGFTATVPGQGLGDLYADHFILEKQFRSWSYTIRFLEPRTVAWVVKGAQIVNDFPEEGQQKGSHFQWEMQANSVPSGGDGRLTITTAPSWDVVSRRYWLLWHKQCEGFKAPLQEALGIAGKNELEIVVALHHYFSKNFQYRQLKRSQHLLQPDDCQKIWESKEGDCKDLALLFYSILAQWGIRTEVVLQASDEYVNIQNELPDSGLFDHALVLINLESGRYLYDPAMEKMKIYQEQDKYRLLHLSE